MLFTPRPPELNGMDSQHTVRLVPSQFTLYMHSRLSLDGETDETQDQKHGRICVFRSCRRRPLLIRTSASKGRSSYGKLRPCNFIGGVVG